MSVAAHRFDNAKRRRPEHHDRQAWLTPAYVLDPVRQLFGGKIGLDPCTEADNPTGAERFYTLPADGCSLPWDSPTVFCNPPYGEARERWVDKCIFEATRSKIVLLIPSATDTRAFQRALRHSTGCVFLRGRLKFGVIRQNSATGAQMAASHGSALLGYGVDVGRLSPLGVVVRPDTLDLFQQFQS